MENLKLIFQLENKLKTIEKDINDPNFDEYFGPDYGNKDSLNGYIQAINDVIEIIKLN